MQIEARVVEAIRDLMHERGWYTFKTHGNAFQAGLPDIWACHPRYGSRWVEVKTPRGHYTPAQRREFHTISAHGGHIWTLIGDVPINTVQLILEINKLQGSANWHSYL